LEAIFYIAETIMISHALTIVVNELNKHLDDAYGVATSPRVGLGNLAEGVIATNGNNGGVLRDMLNLSIVNIKEEKSLKNLPNQVRNDITLKVAYDNPPVFLNFQILLAATHFDYTNALLMLSRAIRFFQFKNVFTQDDVAPGSLTINAPSNQLDQLESFKLIFDLYSPTMEEVNHLWGTLGGKQYPFVMYMLRMLDLKFRAIQSESRLITEVTRHLYRKDTVTN
jgi:hypothetical protein